MQMNINININTVIITSSRLFPNSSKSAKYAAGEKSRYEILPEEL